ncbi:MAG: hypothetical protein ABI807_14550 [Sporichthyaceae bacterium]
MSDEQPGGWPRPENEPPVPPGWAPQQPPAQGPTYGGPTNGDPTNAGAPQPGWQQPGAPTPGWAAQPGPGQAAPAAPKPGIIPLRPLGVGEILDGAIAAMRRHWRIMLGLSAAVAAVTQVLSIPLKWLLLHDAIDTSLQTSSSSDPEGQLTVLTGAITSGGIEALITAFAVLVLSGILTAAVSRAVLGQPISTREAWDRARPRIPALLGVSGLLLLVAVGLVALCLLPGVLLALGGAPGALVALAFVIGVPVFVVVATYLYFAFSLASPAVVLEGASVVASLRRSRALVKGSWWRTFGILLLVNVIAQVVTGILLTPFQLLSFLAAHLAGDDGNIYALVPLLVGAIGTILAATITWPFTAVATTLLYIDRRMRREALDLELVRAVGAASTAGPQAGTSPAGQSPPRL